MSEQMPKTGLRQYLSPAAAWALAVGTSVGWGSLVVTSNTYLVQAGPLGSIFGLLIGMALMLVICRNVSFMANRYPRAGGIYDYTKEVFGCDRAFLVFWFLSLIYISMFWANATSLPLFKPSDSGHVPGRNSSRAVFRAERPEYACKCAVSDSGGQLRHTVHRHAEVGNQGGRRAGCGPGDSV